MNYKSGDNKKDSFDLGAGSLFERIMFKFRACIIVIFVLITVFFGMQIPKLELNSDFEKVIPTNHPYIQNYLDNESELAGLGNAVQVVVVSKTGTIYDHEYLSALRDVSESLYLIPGVARPFMKSLWTPSTRWLSVTERGLDGGPVIPGDYDGSDQSIEVVKINIERSNEIGKMVAFDQASSSIYVPLLRQMPDGAPIDYSAFNQSLEDIRAEYGGDKVEIRIIGFAKITGDLLDGMQQIFGFFLMAIFLAGIVLYWYTRCARSTVIVLLCSLLAVVWLLGLLPILGLNLDPYSILVPFLVFAIGMSHGAQKMNGIMQDVSRGLSALSAARATFRRLFIPGVTALISDAVGFAVLMVIQIGAIQELALSASIGVAVLILSNLIVLPLILSYTGVRCTTSKRSRSPGAHEGNPNDMGLILNSLSVFATKRWAMPAIAIAIFLGVGGYLVGLQLKVGDLGSGAAELHEDSRYNRDNAYVNEHYGSSSDVFAVMVSTPAGQCADYETLRKVEALDWRLREINGVSTTSNLATLNRQVLMGMSEGSPRWFELIDNQRALNANTGSAPRGLYNNRCDLLTLYVYLDNRKATTLEAVVAKVEDFSAEFDTGEVTFQLAAGNAGIEAATNIVVDDASTLMLYLIYSAVVLMCLITFRSWRATLCAVIPLFLTTVLSEALMVVLGLGIKVSTLPVMALGVGIGIDYALYIMSMLLVHLRNGKSVFQAYRHSLAQTGRIVILTGMTLSCAVLTWVFSPIKFQSDMGAMLAFMLVWNMVGSLVLLPALACFLFTKSTRKVDERLVTA